MKQKKIFSDSRGFTAMTAIMAISILAVLIIVIFSTTKQQTALERDSQRISDINNISKAVAKRIIDNSGTFEGLNLGNNKTCPVLSDTPMIITVDKYITARTVGLDCLVTTYLAKIPSDPTTGSGITTGYKIYKDGDKKIHVIADTPEPTIPRTEPLEIVQ